MFGASLSDPLQTWPSSGQLGWGGGGA